jgi:hypothetical protein
MRSGRVTSGAGGSRGRRRVGPGAEALRLPHRLAEALEHRVQRVVLVAVHVLEPLELGAYPGRLVDGELLGDREVQRQVQERVHRAAVGRVVALEVPLALVDDRVVLGMHRDERRHRALEVGRRLARAGLAPRLDDEAARLVSRRGEHQRPRPRLAPARAVFAIGWRPFDRGGGDNGAGTILRTVFATGLGSAGSSA